MPIYNPADIARLLKVKEPTVRKYSLLLEEVGYTFKRNASGQRWYEDKDVIALQKLVAFKGNGDMKLKDAAEAVFHWSKGENVTQPLTVIHNDTDRNVGDITDDISPDVTTVTELLKAQERLYLEAFEKLEQRQADRDKVLLETIDELKQLVQEQRRQLDAPAAERSKLNAAEAQPQQPGKEKRRGFWAWLWRK